IDRRRLSLLLGRGITLLYRCQLELIYVVKHFVEFGLKARITAYVRRTFEKQVESTVKVDLGRVLVTGVVLIEPNLVFLIDGRDQFRDEIRLGFCFRLCRGIRLISRLSR